MAEKKYEVITIGGSTLDIFMKDGEFEISKKVDDTEQLCMTFGDKIIVDDVHFTYGGGGMNTAVSFAYLGLSTAFIGIVGDDEIGKGILKRVEERGIAHEYITESNEGKSGLSVALHAGKRERTLLLFRGVNDQLKPTYLKEEVLNSSKWLYLSHLSGDSDTCIEKFASFLGDHPETFLAWNPGSTQLKKGIEHLSSLLAHTTILNINKEEAELLSGLSIARDPNLKEFQIDDLTPIHEKLSALGPKIVVITDGKKGASVYEDGNTSTSENHEIDSVKDTTGAGDAFGSGFVAGYSVTGNVTEALQWGIIQSGAVITQFGAQNGLLSRERLEAIQKHL
ncbi:carbohydrate kinase family protein [Patescibacteria group bacterium]|nr:carbohydrate kinase family protein [Patescibacteria group bacterium]